MRTDFWNGDSGLLFPNSSLSSQFLRRYGAGLLLHWNHSELFLADAIEIVLPITVSLESTIARFDGLTALLHRDVRSALTYPAFDPSLPVIVERFIGLILLPLISFVATLSLKSLLVLEIFVIDLSSSVACNHLVTILHASLERCYI